MLQQKKRAAEARTRELREAFKRADKDGDGALSQVCTKHILSHQNKSKNKLLDKYRKYKTFFNLIRNDASLLRKDFFCTAGCAVLLGHLCLSD